MNQYAPEQNDDVGLDAAQTQQLLEVLEAVRRGDVSARMTVLDGSGAASEVAASLAALIEQLHAFALDTSKLAQKIGVEGELGAQIEAAGVNGVWKEMAGSLNSMSLILAAQLRDIARVAQAVAEGDLSHKVTVAAQGEVGALKESLNAMIDQLSLLKSSVSRMMEHVSALSPSPAANQEEQTSGGQ